MSSGSSILLTITLKLKKLNSKRVVSSLLLNISPLNLFENISPNHDDDDSDYPDVFRFSFYLFLLIAIITTIILILLILITKNHHSMIKMKAKKKEM